MKQQIKYITSIILLSLTLSTANMNAIASEKLLSKAEALSLVQPFYDLLSGKDTEKQVRSNMTKDWVSYSSNTKFDPIDPKMKFLSDTFHQMVPNLNWKIIDLQVTTDNKIIVRGEGSGTPAGESFFGAPMSGKSFKIMSIDIHTLENGKIKTSHHIEDWAGALQQLSGGKAH